MTKTIHPPEDAEQTALISWFRLNYKNHIIFSIPNGGTRNKIEAVTLKKTGLTAGVPDLQILKPDGSILFLEMKRQKGGRLSGSQKEMFPKIEKLGFEIIIGYGFKDAKEKLEAIL